MAEKFEYNYSAPTTQERKEIESIRSKYLPKEKVDSKIERIKYLDNKISNTKIIFSLTFGIISLLLFGTGLSFFLEITEYWYIGIPFSIVGTVMMLINYPLYNRISEKLKEKYGEEIVKLSNEILEEDK